MKSHVLLFAVVLVYCLAGCNTEGPRTINWVEIESSERTSQCVVLNSELKKKFSFETRFSRKLDRDRLQVVAEIRNRTDGEVVAEISTAFRDKDGSVVDQSIWKKYALLPNHTLAYRVSSIVAAETFCVRIRMPE